jgi:hypothetical protein
MRPSNLGAWKNVRAGLEMVIYPKLFHVEQFGVGICGQERTMESREWEVGSRK